MRRRMSDQNKQASNRSEQVRQRREQRGQHRVSRVVKPVRTQAVTVRGSLFGKPIHQSAGTRNARRQFYVAMDHAGTEMRLPAIPVIRPGWRLLSGLIAILAIACLYLMWTSPVAQVTYVEMSGLERISAEEIFMKAELINLTIMEIDPRAVELTLSQSFPDLVDVKVSVSLPAVVSLTAVERQPVAVWYRGEQASWLDADGMVFPIRGDAGPLLIVESDEDLPSAPVSLDELTRELNLRITDRPAQNEGFLGLFFPQPKEDEKPLEPEARPLVVDPAFLVTAQQLSERIPPDVAVLYDGNNGLGWYDERGTQVYIGRDMSTFETKFAMYQRISSHLNEQGIRAALISVEHLNAPFYRLEQ
jgi:cell division protein FtsQ